MKTELLIEAIDTHTAGEPTRIITGGLNVDQFSGESVRERRDAFREDADELRELLMKEPRGHDDMYGAVTVPPGDDRADIGVFFIDNGGYKDMCGHGTIGVVTGLMETGYLDQQDIITIETPAGIVAAEVDVADGGAVDRVTVQNVDSYVITSTALSVDIDGGVVDVPIDVVYAGNTFVMAPASAFGISIDTTNTDAFVEYGLELRDRVNSQLDLRDPIDGTPIEVDHTEFYETGEEADRNIVIFSEGSIDRSPCGTGTCAKMTLLYTEDDLEIGTSYLHESVIGTRFEGELTDVREIEGTTVATPQVAGSAYIVSKSTFLLDPDDPVWGFNI